MVINMNIGKKLQAALNKQINAELYSAYIYLSMAAYFDSENLDGLAHWMKVQSNEEVGHAMKMYKFINGRGGRVTLEAIEKPKVEWKSPLAVFEDAYAHEQEVTSMIEALVELARKEKDFMTESMLKWFVDEQVEEEDSARAIVEQLKMIKDSKNALLMLDHHLGKRKAG